MDVYELSFMGVGRLWAWGIPLTTTTGGRTSSPSAGQSARLADTTRVKRDAVGTSLHKAAAVGDAGAVRRLLAEGADVNATAVITEPTPNYWVTPLMLAAEAGHAAIAHLLLEHGAAVNAQDREGWTPLMRAAAYWHVEVARLLLAYGADVYRKNNTGETALIWALNKGATEIVKLLMKSGAYFTRGACANTLSLDQLGASRTHY
ncbi:MAG TPA: ankyrin repeat domain-containing protein [Pyrinomonadaceae bacterium]|jgi:ankyrin repeat protein